MSFVMAARSFRVSLALALVVLAALALPGTTEASFLTEAKKLTASDAQAGDAFGRSVAVSGDTAVVGAWKEDAGGSNAGAAYVLQRNVGGTDNWGEVAKLTASDAEASDWFGLSVAVSGDTIIVGAPYEDAEGSSAGAAYVFQRNQGGADNWGEVTKLTPSGAEAYANFGADMAVSDDTVVVGARNEGASDTGAVYIFQRDQGGSDNWGEVKKLTASDAEAYDRFGSSLTLEGETAVVGARVEDAGGAYNAGSAYVFERDLGGADNWGEVKKLIASDAEEADQFGTSVALSGDTLIVGAFTEDAGGSFDAGAAYVFERNLGGAGNWGEVKKLTASDSGINGYFAFAVAVDGDTAVLGVYGDTSTGTAYFFERNEGGAGNWGEVAKLASSDGQPGDWLGYSAALTGNTVILGARGEDAAGTGAGAAYVFDLLGPKTTPTITQTPTITPTPTTGPTSTPVQSGGAWSLRVEVSQQTGCPGGPVAGKVCVGLGQQFDVIVTADASVKPNVFSEAQAWIDYDDQGLVHKKNTEMLWECLDAAFLTRQDAANNGAAASCAFVVAPIIGPFVNGDLYSFLLTCPNSQSSSNIQILPVGDPVAGTSGSMFIDWDTNKRYVPAVSGITVNCVPPTATPTPGPLPVGGMALDGSLRAGAALEPESSSGRVNWRVAGIVAMAAALATGALALTHARRRW